MFLTGSIKFDDQEYFIAWKDIKSSEVLWCFSPYHKDDNIEVQMGGAPKNPIIVDKYVLKNFYNENYVIEIMKRLKVSGEVSVYGQPQIIETFMDTLAFARNYKFAKDDVKRDLVSQMCGMTTQDFIGSDNHISMSFTKEDLFFTRLDIEYSGVSIHMEKAPFSLKEKVFTLVDADRLYKKRILTKTIKDIDYAALCDSLDMTWYRDGDVLKKDYWSIKSVFEFETKIMTPMLKKIKECYDEGKKFYVSVDTETTGLNVYNLDKNNPDKDHVVAIPITWTPDAGFVIFTDMEHFANVDNDYCVRRLAEIFENFKGERTIECWEPCSEDTIKLQEMNVFDDKSVSNVINDSDLSKCKKTAITINRNTINLIGHNVMFDKKAFIDSNCYFYFDDDTMQMSFNLASKLVKGSNKLKTLTRKLFGHETPELTDILGKGNEDKYRFLANEEVARIYGCADADYTLQVFYYLRTLTTDSMYEKYKALDVPMLNILPRSEYYGLQMQEEKALMLGDAVFHDIEILKQFAYRYVGIFVNYYRQREKIEARKAAGLFDSDEAYQDAVNNIKISDSAIYEFEFKPNELRTVLFEILKYPIKAWTEGKKALPKLDKYAMKKLVQDKRPEGSTDFNKLEHNIYSYGHSQEEYDELMAKGTEKAKKKAESLILIDADEFNKCKYPLALVLQKYAELNKEYTAYFKPMKETNLEGKIFKSYSLARIETRRIQNAAQTMKGNLKDLVKAYNEDYYLLDFDMSQVEYRIMLSLAGYMAMVDKMKDPEKDYHTETASLVNGIPAHKVDKKTRKSAKSVSFGVPYGLGERSLCEKIFGDPTEEHLFATRLLLAKWEKANKPIMEFLNSERDNALIARAMSDDLRDFMDAWEKNEDGSYKLDPLGKKIPKPTGFVYDKYGFYRTFDVSNIDQSESAKRRRATGHYTSDEAKIRRPAGNFPIQCFAAEMFRIILIRFYNRCEEEGINDKLIWHMLIHDELLCSVHKSIHPFFIYKLVKESCMITMKGHTNYFVGINIGNTWGEVKDDAREAPVYFVDRIVKRWDSGEFGNGPFWFDNPWDDLIKDERAKYVDERIWEVIHEVQKDIDNAPINIPYIMEHFDNYTVRAYVKDGYSLNNKVVGDYSGDEKADREWASRFETWALGRFPIGKPIINYDGKLVVLRNGNYEEGNVSDPLDLDTSLFFEDDDEDIEANSYWSFDTTECNNAFDAEISDDSSDDDVFMYALDDEKQGAHNIAEMLQVTRKYNNLSVMLEQVVITTSKNRQEEIKRYLQPYVTSSGKSIVFIFRGGGAERWLKVNDQVNWDKLDEFIKEIDKIESLAKSNKSYKPELFTLLNNNLVITLSNKYKFVNCENWLMNFESHNGYGVILKTPLGDIRKLPIKIMLDFKKLDNYLRKEL